MADNDLQDMVRRIQKTLPRPLDELSREDLQNHLADIANNPSQYGLPGVGAQDPGSVLRSKAIDQIREQHTVARPGADPGSDWIMNTGLEGVRAPSPDPQPHPPDPDTIDHLFDPTDMGPNEGIPGAPGLGDDGLDELLRETGVRGGPVPEDVMTEWITDIGLEAVDVPPTGPPHPPDPTNIDDLFDPTDLGPNATLPGTRPPMDPELEELLRQTDALRPPSGPAPQEGIDVPMDPGDAMAAVPMDDPTRGVPSDAGMMPEGGGSGDTGSDTSGFNC